MERIQTVWINNIHICFHVPSTQFFKYCWGENKRSSSSLSFVVLVYFLRWQPTTVSDRGPLLRWSLQILVFLHACCQRIPWSSHRPPSLNSHKLHIPQLHTSLFGSTLFCHTETSTMLPNSRHELPRLLFTLAVQTSYLLPVQICCVHIHLNPICDSPTSQQLSHAAAPPALTAPTLPPHNKASYPHSRTASTLPAHFPPS